MPAVAITGANGWLGQELMKSFASAIPVKRLVRQPLLANDRLWDAIASSPEETARALNSCDTVIHCAAFVHKQTSTTIDQKLCWETNVGGTKRLIAGAKLAGVRRFINVSSISVYDFARTVSPREADANGGNTPYGRSKYEAEKLVEQSGLEFVNLRLATMFGEGDFANLAKLSKHLQRRLFIQPGAGAASKSFLSVRQAVNFIQALLNLKLLPCVALNVAIPTPVTLEFVCRTLARALNAEPPHHLPAILFQAGALVGSLISVLYPAFPLTLEVYQKLTTNSAVSTQRALELLPQFSWTTFESELTHYAWYYRCLK